MKNEEYIKKLVEVGLLPREARVYLALLSKNSFTATEISKVSAIPRQKIYEILDNIIKKGICVERVGKVKRYKAVEPESVFRGLIEQYKEKEKLALEISDDLSELYEKNRERYDPLEYIKIFKEKKQIADLFQKLEKKAKKEVLVFTKAPYSLSLEENIIEFEMLSVGVKVKAIYEGEEIIKKNYFNIIDAFVSAGEVARVANELPLKLAVFDDKLVLLALRDPITHHPSITTILIEQNDFVRIIKVAFEKYWNLATPWDEFKKNNLNP